MVVVDFITLLPAVPEFPLFLLVLLPCGDTLVLHVAEILLLFTDILRSVMLHRLDLAMVMLPALEQTQHSINATLVLVRDVRANLSVLHAI